MAERSDLEASRYLIEVYTRASTGWYDFQRTHQAKTLWDVSIELCEGYRRLTDDGQFWAVVHDMPKALEKHRNQVLQILSNMDDLFEIERQALSSLPEADAERLITDVAFAIQSLHEPNLPSSYDVENLRSKVKALGDAMCNAVEVSKEAANSGKKPKKFLRAALNVGRGVLVVGGCSLFVGNLVSSVIAPPAAWASAFAGFSAVVTQLDHFEKSRNPQ